MTTIFQSQYSKHKENLLNIHNSSKLYLDIEKNIISLYNDTISGKIKLLNQTEITESYYDFQSRIPLEVIENMFTKEGSGYSGFNKVSISSVTFSPETLLERIEEYYTYILSNLKNIKNLVTKDLSIYQKLNRLYFKFETDDLMLLENSNLFKYFCYSKKYLGEKDEEKSFIVNLFLFLMLQPIYNSSFLKISKDYRFKCFTTSDSSDINITNDELRFTKYDIYSGFNSFIDNNTYEFSFELSNYLAKNVFILNEPSIPFIVDLTELLQEDLIPKIRDRFNNISIINSYQQTLAINIIKSLHEYILVNDISSRSSYIDIPNESDIINEENYIFQKFNEILNLNQKPNFISLEYIIYQFREFPLFFLNSYFIAYNNYLNDILQNTNFMESIDFIIAINQNDNTENIPNIVNWMSMINIDGIEFKNHLNNINLFEEFENSKALDYNFSLFFIELIDTFINSDEFHELIVIDLPNKIKGKSNYIREYRDLIINNVGRIKTFIKLYLLKKIIDKELFGELYQEFKDVFNLIIPEFSDTVDVDNYTSSFKNTSVALRKMYLEYIKGLFYSAHVSDFLNRLLNNYRI